MIAVMALLLVLRGRIKCDEEIKRPHIIFILGEKKSIDSFYLQSKTSNHLI